MTLNGWSYVEGNPTNLTDSSGHCSVLPQVGLSVCEKFVREVEQFIRVGKSHPNIKMQALGLSNYVSSELSDDHVVSMLAAYYAGFTLGAIPELNVPNTFIVQERKPAPAKARSLDRYDRQFYNLVPRAEAETVALNYGFKRIFYDNTHHYFANFYMAWVWGRLGANVSNVIWESGNQASAPTEFFQMESRADEAIVKVAIDHVNQTQGWIGLYDDITLLPSLLRKDLCADTIGEIYEGWDELNSNY